MKLLNSDNPYIHILPYLIDIFKNISKKYRKKIVNSKYNALKKKKVWEKLKCKKKKNRKEKY